MKRIIHRDDLIFTFVPKILESEDFSLSPGKYRLVDTQATDHDAPKDILREVLEMEDEITKKVKLLQTRLPKS